MVQVYVYKLETRDSWKAGLGSNVKISILSRKITWGILTVHK